MSQARTLTEQELKRVLNYIATKRHAARNRTMLLLTYYAGLRVGEVASLRVGDVMGSDGAIRSEFRLTADQTKGGRPRTIFVSDKLKRELAAYCK